MANPNLFDFATSELSQDAFLCWLAALAEHDDIELAALGRAFIAWLWNRARNESADPSGVRLISPPRRQHSRIDILFEAEVGSRRALFLIEDKTNTTHHSGQLARYASVVRDRNVVVPIYFKTGYHFGADIDAESHGYTVIGLGEWVEFLSEHRVDNDIFADYLAAMERTLDRRESSISRLFTASGHVELAHDFAQFEFVKRLVAACPETIGASAIDRGRNRDGSPWTHLRFATFDDALPGRIREILFHRIDRRGTGYYLSTRQYAAVKGRPEAQAAKLQRRLAYIAWFDAAVDRSRPALRFARPSGDRRGANESEIAILFFDDSTNTTARVMEELPAIHGAFVQAAHAHRLA